MHDHLTDPLPEDSYRAALHLHQGHGYGVHPSMSWDKIAVKHATLHGIGVREAPDTRIKSGSASADDRPDSGSAPA